MWFATATNEYIKIKEVKFSEEGTAEIAGVKYDPAVLAWNAKDDQVVAPRNNYDFTVDTPTNITLIGNETGNSAFGIGRLEWDYPETSFASRYTVEYTTSSNPLKYVLLGEAVDNSFEIANLRTNIYKFHVRARDAFGRFSTRNSSVFYNFAPKSPVNLEFILNTEGTYEKGSGVLSWQTQPDTFFRRFLVEYAGTDGIVKRLGYTTDTEFVIDLGVGVYSLYVSTESFSGELSDKSNLENIIKC